jgi:hypothetical protein
MFNAPADKVWGTLIKVVTAARYPIAKTDQAAKQIVYQASGGAFAWAQNVQVSVTEIEDDETMVSIVAEAAGQSTLTEGAQQQKLIAFIVEELSKKFPLAEHQPQTAAPGTSGCAGVMLLLISGLGGTLLCLTQMLVL